MKNLPTKLSLASIVVAFIATVACKPQGDSSETQSLDNFAKRDGEALTVNQCGINYTGSEQLSTYVTSVKERVVGETSFKNVAIGVMEAVPENLLKAFFGMKGRVLITSKAASLCRAVEFSAGERDLAGDTDVVPACWRQPAPGQPIEIVLPENNEIIRHSLLRLFAYTFSEAFVATIQASSTGSLATDDAKEAAEGFAVERDRISAAFLSDLKSMNRPEVLAKLSSFNDKDSEKFGNYVYAEAIDSYYCSAKSRATFQSLFNRTWSTFTDVKNANAPVNLFGKR